MRKLLALFICVLVFVSSAHPSAADGTYATLGTPDSADGSADAINFSQGRVWTVDRFGKYIWLTQNRSLNHHWAWSNDLGASWTQGSEEYGYLTRGSVAYDPDNDRLHVVWAGINASDGIIYRRYAITRDGANNISAIAADDLENVNLTLDSTTSPDTLAQPVAVWVDDGSSNGILVAAWERYGPERTEVRATMRRLSLSGDDGIAANWTALDGSGDTFSAEPPAVAADLVYGSAKPGTSVPAATLRGGTGSFKDDLYIFVAENVNADSRIVANRAAWSSADNNWSGGWQEPVVVGQMNNTGGGYDLKYELITKPVLDARNDRLYIGWPRWKDGTAGDTVSVAYLDGSDAPSAPIDVYSANGKHSYAPTLDLAFDDTLGQLYVAYVLSTTNGDNGSIEYKTFDGAALSEATRFYTSTGGAAGAGGGADIPILYQSRSNNNRMLVGFRKNGALPPTEAEPHTIYWGSIALAVPTPTPTATPAPTATPPPPTATPAPVPSPSASPEASPPAVQGWFGSVMDGIGGFFERIREFFN